MWVEACRFELRLQLKQPTTFVLLLLGFSLAALQAFGHTAMFIAPVPVQGAPLGLVWGVGITMLLLPVLSALPIARAALRENMYRAGAWLDVLGKPVSYRVGRIVAAGILSMALATAIALPFVLVYVFPSFAAYPLAKLQWSALLWAAALFAIPGALISTGFLYAAAAHFGTLSAALLSAVGLFVCMFAANNLASSQAELALLDPFGVRLFTREVLMAVPFAERAYSEVAPGVMLNVNRLLWVCLALLAVGMSVFKGSRPSYNTSLVDTNVPVARHEYPVSPPRPAGLFLSWLCLFRFVSRDCTYLLRTPTLRVAVLVLSAVLLVELGRVEPPFFYPSYPSYAVLLGALGGVFSSILCVAIALVTGELVHREQELRISSILDCIRQLTNIRLMSKAIGVGSAALVLYGMGAISLACYSQVLVGIWPDMPFWYGAVMVAAPGVVFALALVPLHALAGSRSAGHVITLAAIGIGAAIGNWSGHRDVLQFAWFPPVWESDLLGLSGVSAWPKFLLYWVVWVLGVWVLLQYRLERSSGARRQRAVALCMLFAAAVLVGWHIHSTSPNDPGAIRDARFAYERDLRMQFLDPQPRLTDLLLNLDVSPERSTVEVAGELRFVNHHPTMIDKLVINIPPGAKFGRLILPNSDVIQSGLLYRVVRLHVPLAPKAEVLITFEAEMRSGIGRISSAGINLPVASFVPALGYNPQIEWISRVDRAREGLGERTDAPADILNSEAVYGFPNVVRANVDVSVKLPPGWTVVVPGELRSEKQELGRRSVRYSSETPILPMFSVVAAPWRVLNDASGRVEVLTSPYHVANAAAFKQGSEAALDYCATLFGAYGRSRLRVAEVSSFEPAAQSHDGVILIPETFGFNADIRADGVYSRLADRMSVDPTLLVAAHEVAHQWWGHRLLPADVIGSPFVMESVAQFLALSVIERVQGQRRWRVAMRQQQREYFEGRANSRVSELPLVRTGSSPHVLYAKGSIALFRLRDAVGENVLDEVLAEYFRDFTSVDRRATPTSFVQYLARAAGENSDLVHELFEEVITYDLIARTASLYTDGVTGRLVSDYEIMLERSGALSPARQKSPARVTVEWRDGEKVILTEQLKLQPGRNRLRATLPHAPTEMIVDPDSLFLDANVNNNRRLLTTATVSAEQ